MDNLRKNYENMSFIQNRMGGLSSVNESDLLDKFPLSIYFQTHFQFIHENEQSMLKEMLRFKNQLSRIEAKLDLLLGNCETKLEK